jgi:hypothetical protein
MSVADSIPRCRVDTNPIDTIDEIKRTHTSEVAHCSIAVIADADLGAGALHGGLDAESPAFRTFTDKSEKLLRATRRIRRFLCN